jgi:glycosyltransferase involved in cell wall biosynthesis
VTKFSIVIPAYNAEATLPETLDAVLAQEFDDWECVVVDDGSTDATLAIAERYATRDPRVRAVSQPNQGTGGAYNTGVLASQGEYIVICSSDDLLLPLHLRVMDSLTVRAPEHGIYSSNGHFLEPSGAHRRFYRNSRWQHELSLSFEDVVGRCFFGVGATYRRDVFDLVGGYRPGVYGEDYDFWLRAMARGVTHRYTPEVLALHRVAESQKSADLLRVLESDAAIYRHLLEAGLVPREHVPAVKRALAEKRTAVRDLLLERRRRALAANARSALGRVVGRRTADRLVHTGLVARRRIRAWIKGWRA